MSPTSSPLKVHREKRPFGARTVGNRIIQPDYKTDVSIVTPNRFLSFFFMSPSPHGLIPHFLNKTFSNFYVVSGVPETKVLVLTPSLPSVWGTVVFVAKRPETWTRKRTPLPSAESGLDVSSSTGLFDYTKSHGSFSVVLCDLPFLDFVFYLEWYTGGVYCRNQIGGQGHLTHCERKW